MERKMKPESLMMSYGYKPELSEGAIKFRFFKPQHLFSKVPRKEKHFLKSLMVIEKKTKGKNLV
jgi:methionine-gamma-lyase